MPANASRSPRILLLEGIHSVAAQHLEQAGLKVELESKAIGEDELVRRSKEFDVIGIRSKTEIRSSFLKQSPHLLAIGAFCIGTNQIDLEAANHLGVPVFNAPYSNTRSVAELIICELIALSRQLGDRNTGAHQGKWVKSAVGSREIRGKTLGIVGYGHIGSQVSILAEAMGLKVIYYDVIKKLPLGNARSVDSLNELLERSDFVTFHVPETRLTQNMMNAAAFKRIKKGAFLLNASRGSVVDIPALAGALKSGQVAGAAVDVFPEEPSSNKEAFRSELQNLPNVILTPHIGGSTEEAQEAIGLEVSESFIRFLTAGSSLGAVNFPHLDAPPIGEARRVINVHKNVPGVLGEVNSIVSKMGVNIRLQLLSTDSHIGYLIVDVEASDINGVVDKIAALPTSIKTRVI